jgi:hypothetical protein
MIYKCKNIVVCLLALTAFNANAEMNSAGMSQEDMAKMSQNPVGNMYSVPLEVWHHDGLGLNEEGSANALFLRPVVPVTVGKFNLINRFIIPYLGIDPNAGTDLGEIITEPSLEKQTGLGNIQYQAIFSPADAGAVIWGLGAVVEFPTHSGNLGSDNYSAGPVALVLSMPGDWVFGTLVQNMWSVGGSSNPNHDVNKLIWQYFVNYNFDDGWYLTTTPIMTADWTKESGEQWTIPVGGGVGKLMKFESFPPLDFKLQAFTTVVRPTGGPEWSAMFSVKLILPKQLFSGK